MNELTADQSQPLKEPSEEFVNEKALEAKQAFVADYGELVKKHGIDFATYPVFIPDGAGGFKVIIQNTPVSINSPTVAPFVQK